MKKLSPIILAFILLSCLGCIPIRSLFLAYPDHKDIHRFPARTIKAEADCFHFEKKEQEKNGPPLMVTDRTSDLPFFVSLDDLLPAHEVRSFIVIQEDKIQYEYYGEGVEEEDIHSSYSIAKSFMSALIGIAIEEQSIGSELELVSKYIPEINKHPEAKLLTIEHLLNHTSGIDYQLSSDAIIYYGKNILNCLNQIKFKSNPGVEQHYLNINIQLLGLVLYRATQQYPSTYLEEKIWKPIQMCSDGIWTIDKKNQLEKTYCCLGATALDYAKFGRLYLNQGNWNGKQIISKAWYDKSIARQAMNGSSYGYNYCWYIGLEAYGDFLANGLYKQNIYIHPKKNIIIVLLKNRSNKLKDERVQWEHVFRQIVDQL